MNEKYISFIDFFVVVFVVLCLNKNLVMTDNAFKARDIGLRAQKKILSRMATKSVAKTFIDGTTASLLDNIYRLAKLHVSKMHYLSPHHCMVECFSRL